MSKNNTNVFTKVSLHVSATTKSLKDDPLTILGEAPMLCKLHQFFSMSSMIWSFKLKTFRKCLKSYLWLSVYQRKMTTSQLAPWSTYLINSFFIFWTAVFIIWMLYGLSTKNDKSPISLISNATAVECSTCKSIPWLKY